MPVCVAMCTGYCIQHRTALEQSRAVHAEHVLRQSDDYVTLGNIHSSYGRMARRAGQYDKAILHFTKAIEEYRKRGSQHPHLVRTLTNIALVKQLISLHIGQKIDAQTKRRRQAAARGQKVKPGAVPPRASREQLREQAFLHLEEAEAINQGNESDQGSSSIHLVYGYLYLDDGDYERAEHHAATGLELARRKNDPIGLSRLSLLHCMPVVLLTLMVLSPARAGTASPELESPSR